MSNQIITIFNNQLFAEQERHCCNAEILEEESTQPDELKYCFNIEVDQSDSFYADRLTCSPFTRSDGICSTSGVREQFNILTSYIDGSNIYGSDEVRAKSLRTMSEGLLKTHRLGPTLPTATDTDLGKGMIKISNINYLNIDYLYLIKESRQMREKN